MVPESQLELTGAPVDEVRRVREDIDRRVQALLAELEPPAAD